MTAAGKWRVRGYWTVAAVLLPLVNPPLLWTGALLIDDTGAGPWIPVALCICLANWLLLRLIAERTWRERDARRWRVAGGVASAVALSFPFGFAELYAVFVLSCPSGGCWN
jgi:hypothetical protein